MTRPSSSEPAIRLTIDAESLTIGDMEDLEIAQAKQSIILILDWLVEHAGVTREALRSLSFTDLSGVAAQIGSELVRQTKLDPKPERPS